MGINSLPPPSIQQVFRTENISSLHSIQKQKTLAKRSAIWFLQNISSFPTSYLQWTATDYNLQSVVAHKFFHSFASIRDFITSWESSYVSANSESELTYILKWNAIYDTNSCAVRSRTKETFFTSSRIPQEFHLFDEQLRGVHRLNKLQKSGPCR